MFELLRSPKTLWCDPSPASRVTVSHRLQLERPQPQSCSASLRNAAFLGCRLGRADAPINVKASTDSAYAHGCIRIPVCLLIARRR